MIRVMFIGIVFVLGLVIGQQAQANAWDGQKISEIGHEINSATIDSILGRETDSIRHLQSAIKAAKKLDGYNPTMKQMLITRWKMKQFYAKYPQYWETAMEVYK